jgi:HTH-type transcriptional regulator/antitoxin HigA
MPRRSEKDAVITPVADSKSHAHALARIQALWDAAPRSADERELDALATLVDAYERRAFPILPLDPVAAIVARMEALSWSRRELEPLIGSRARVSEVLTRKRALTLPMIRRLHAALGIPADILIAEPVKKARRPASATTRTAHRRSA